MLRPERLTTAIRSLRHSFGLALVAVGLVVQLAPLSAESRREVVSLEIYQSEERLALLPLANRSDDRSLDYLSDGVVRMLEGRLGRIGYLPLEQPRPRLRARVAHNGDDSAAAARRPERHQPERVQLTTAIIANNPQNYAHLLFALGAEQARRLNADYLLGGEIVVVDSGEVSAELELYRAADGERFRFTLPINRASPYRQIDSLYREIRSTLAGREEATLEVESQSPGAMIYLDENYLGRTPLSERVTPGDYRLRIVQEGFEQIESRLILVPGGAEVLYIRNVALRHTGRLLVESQPAGASLYLNEQFLGTTPLDVDGLPEGTHRLRLSLEGYIDRYIGVELGRAPIELSLALQQGSTLAHYRDPGYILLDWDRHDFAFYGAFTSVFFYMGWMYGNIEANRVEDSLRSEFPNLAFWDLPTLTLYHHYRIEANRVEAKRWRNRAKATASLGVANLLVAGYFFYQALQFDDKEAGERIERGAAHGRRYGEMEPIVEFGFSPFAGAGIGSGAGVQMRKSDERQYRFGLRLYL